MRQFLLPDLGIGNKDAEIVDWYVAAGDQVDADSPLVSVETEKATIEIPSPWRGRIARLLAEKGELVKVGAPLLEFAEAAEEGAGRVATRLTATVRKVRQPAAPSPKAAIRQFVLPDLGIGDKDAEVIAWHVAVGDQVTADEPLVSIETEKATIEIPSPWTGRITRILANTGNLVKVGAPLVEVAEGAGGQAADEPDLADGPDAADAELAEPSPPQRPVEPPRARAEAPAAAPRPTPAPRPAAAAPQRAPKPAAPPRPAPAPRAAAAPAQALARELGVDPKNVRATGPGGSVTHGDVERAAQRRADEDANWGDVKELPAEGSHLMLALALVVIVLCGLFIAWWLDPMG